jgi:hypothetical protein
MVYTAFHGFRRVATGSAMDLIETLKDKPQGEFLVFDDSTGSQIELDLRGKPTEIAYTAPDEAATAEPRGRGRPRLGVIAKEVTLLPRHWDWLNAQPGGASVALRRLVDEARKTSGDRDRVRATQEAAYRFMSAIAASLPGFEEATRALFAYDLRRFTELVATWPQDVRDYVVRLVFGNRGPAQT